MEGTHNCPHTCAPTALFLDRYGIIDSTHWAQRNSCVLVTGRMFSTAVFLLLKPYYVHAIRRQQSVLFSSPAVLQNQIFLVFKFLHQPDPAWLIQSNFSVLSKPISYHCLWLGTLLIAFLRCFVNLFLSILLLLIFKKKLDDFIKMNWTLFEGKF